MTINIALTPDQTSSVISYDQQAETSIGNDATKTITNQFVFFAAFDGTNNTLLNKPAANPQTTNVAALWNQYQSSIVPNSNFGGQYYAGLGTPGTLTGSSALPWQVTAQAIITANNAYNDFVRQASAWLQDPKNAGGSVTAALTSFSRGDASAAMFSQLLFERGLVVDGKVLIAPGQVGVSAGVIFDPVTTGVSGNLAFAPNVKNVVEVRALDEYRYAFESTNYANQPGVTTVNMIGNHCDIGGGYDNGVAALSLQAATTFFKNSGITTFGDVLASRGFNSEQVVVHSEGDTVYFPTYRMFDDSPADLDPATGPDETTIASYDAHGVPTGVIVTTTSDQGVIQTSSYDGSGKLTGSVVATPDSAGNINTANYDAAGLLTSYVILATNGLGDTVFTTYDSQGRRLHDDVLESSGAQVSTDYQLDGSSVATATALDGSYGVAARASSGDLVTTQYSDQGVRLSDTWNRGDGSSGTDTFNADGTTSSRASYADGTSASIATSASGQVTTTHYAADGTTVTGSTVTTSSQGNITTINYDAKGATLSETWAHADGTSGTGSDTPAPNQNVSTAVSYTLAAGEVNLTGTGSANVTLTGNALNNVITANSGNDTLVAGGGLATLAGGIGSDTFVINNPGDVVQAQTGGVNTVQTSVSYIASTNVKNVTGTGSADLTLTGNNLNNVITGNAGNDTLIAGSGNATLVSGSGTDQLIGGVGHNVFKVNNAADVVVAQANALSNDVQTSVSYIASTNVKNVTGTGSADLTFAVRHLEPYRGYHVFMRALPLLQRLRPQARVVIVGGDGVSYGAAAPAGKTWGEIFLAEVANRIDLSRIHFVGWLPHPLLTQLMQVSAAHVYLTYPFVLSWSLLEAMSVGCLVIGSDTAPVREVIEHGHNGLLTDFFDADALAHCIADALERRVELAALRLAARETIRRRYDLHQVCLPAQLAMVQEVCSAAPARESV